MGPQLSLWQALPAMQILHVHQALKLTCTVYLHTSCAQVFCAHPGLTRTDHFGKADTDEKWSSRWVEAFANSFWGTDGSVGALPLMFACTEPRLNGEAVLPAGFWMHT